ncbi:MAG: hypothetical protein ACJ74Y_03935, partial [Bryobacteraceae bacterium]
FRDMADFCVLVLYDADNTFEHYTVRYLPDFDFSGMTLSFNVAYRGLQPLDSSKYSWIDWSQLDVIRKDESTARIPLWDHASLVSGNYAVAQGAYGITAPNGCTIYDRLTLFVNNASFDFLAGGGESAAYVARTFANAINSYDWSTFSSHSVSVIASADDSGKLTLKNARTGKAKVSGATVQWAEGIKFPGIAPGSKIYLGGVGYTVSAVTSPTTLSLTSPAQAVDGSTVTYLAEYGGSDGNSVATYMVVRPGNVTLAVDRPELHLSGGNSDDLVWNITLDFTALGIEQIRQAWMTFAPQLTPASVYTDTEWTAAFSNWYISDPLSKRVLSCAGPASVRIGNDIDSACQYSGSGWSRTAANNYWQGFGQVTSTQGDSVTITYSATAIHDLYLGTSLYPNRATVEVSLDGDTATELSCALPITSELVTRRLVRASVPSGLHSLSLKLVSTGTFVFDYLDAAVLSDFCDAPVVYNNVSPALDYDTDATYKVSPQRLLWHLTKLGFRGQINEYLGVFWWNQRKRAGGLWNSATVNFGGTWAPGDIVTVALGTGASRFPIHKSVTTWDTVDTIATHFAQYINSASVSMWAEKTGAGQLTIHTRTPNWGDILDLAQDQPSAAGTVSGSGNLAVGVDGTWQIDPAASNPINFPIRQWHSDFFSLAAAQNVSVTVSFSMELVNPPDDGTPANTWIARYADGGPVTTDTGFANLSSSQCPPIPSVASYQKAAYKEIARLQSEAGLVPWLQFGEFLWWFFSSMSQPIGYCSYTDPVSIGLANPHGMETGDRVVLTGVRGCTSANGTWTITVTDPTHFTIPVSANGSWVTSTGRAVGGSMAYYDPITKAAAQTALGRPLYKFTCQDDDPGVNSSADSNFLANQLKTHIDTIRAEVLAAYPKAKFEILYPNDVNNAVCHSGEYVSSPQGGRLNAAVNLPAAWRAKATSGFDRFKVEALSWSAQYHHLDLAEQAIYFALTSPMSWDTADVAYLVPWFNGSCPWPAEFRFADSRGIALINFWAYDHLAMMSWQLPIPSPTRRSFFSR